MKTKRHQYNAHPRSDRYQDNGAAVDATTGSDGRCVWVQSQWEMCQDDLTTIFSALGVWNALMCRGLVLVVCPSPLFTLRRPKTPRKA